MRASLILGSIVLAALWLGPLPELARGAFWAHMTLHMGVVAVAAPLLALGMAGGRFDPVPRLPALFSPIWASVLELLVVWVWHAPAAHHFARSSTLGLVLEQATFAGTGLLLWLSALGADGRHGGERTFAGVLALLLTSMHMTLLGALLALPPRVLYPHAQHAHHAAGALTPLQDQHLGGAIMLLLGGVVYLLGGLWLSALILRRGPRPSSVPLVKGAPP